MQNDVVDTSVTLNELNQMIDRLIFLLGELKSCIAPDEHRRFKNAVMLILNDLEDVTCNEANQIDWCRCNEVVAEVKVYLMIR